MKHQQKVKTFINESGVFNVSALCKKAHVNRFHMHKYLAGEMELPEYALDALVVVLKKFGYK